MKLKNLLLTVAFFTFFVIVYHPLSNTYASHTCPPEDNYTPPDPVTIAPDGTPDYLQCFGTADDCPTCLYPSAFSSRFTTKCKKANRFSVGDPVYVKGDNVWLDTPSTQISVNIYITQNRTWLIGDSIAPYVVVGPIAVTTEEYTIFVPDDCDTPHDADTEPDTIPDPCLTQRGKIPCTQIWSSAVAGQYDIVIDAATTVFAGDPPVATTTDGPDGIYNRGDAVDGRSKKTGFKVVQ